MFHHDYSSAQGSGSGEAAFNCTHNDNISPANTVTHTYGSGSSDLMPCNATSYSPPLYMEQETAHLAAD